MYGEIQTSAVLKRCIETRRGRMVYRTNAVAPLAGDDAPTIVLVHGLIVSARYMLPFMRILAPVAWLYAPDLPGYGDSVKPRDAPTPEEAGDALADFMDAVELRRAHALSNSYGCQILAEFAANHSTRVDRLVLNGPTTEAGARNLPQQIGRFFLNSRHEPSGLTGILLRDYYKCGMRRIRQTMRYSVEHHIEDILPRVRAPTMIVRGGNDEFISQEWAEYLTSLLPRGELRVIPGLGHTVNFAGLLELLRVIRPFLGLPRLPGRGTTASLRGGCSLAAVRHLQGEPHATDRIYREL